jgi:hypothetical protein
MINGLLLLAVSPLAALALPVDPNDQAGQWDPSGQYRKGHYDQSGQFIPNNDDNRYNQVNQNGNVDRYGQWRNNNQNDQNGWTDANGQWHANNENNQGGWTDANGQWHANNNQDQNGWTDANGQWHANNQNNQGGWTDANGQWHANQKRDLTLGQTMPTGAEAGRLNQPGLENKASPIGDLTAHTPHRRSWRQDGENGNGNYYNNNDDYNRNGDYNRYDDYNRDDDYSRDDDSWYRENWDRASRVAHDLTTPTPIFPRDVPSAANNWNSVNGAQTTPSTQNGRYESYGNYKNYGSYQNYPANPQDQNQDKDIKAITGQQE